MLDMEKERRMKRGRAFNLEAALQDPALSFDEPNDVVAAPNLTRGVKLKLLQQWERDARALSVAEEEGMTGGEESMLARVLRAQRDLGLDESPAQSQTTKHGT
jgi:hypothetical protein